MVILVEPNSKLINKLFASKSNIDIDFYISDLIVISTESDDWTYNSRFKGFKWNSPVKIQSTNLDYLIKSYGSPDILKVDVEGKVNFTFI